MASLPVLPVELFRFAWSSAGAPLAEVVRQSQGVQPLGAEARSAQPPVDVDMVEPDAGTPVGTLQTFVDGEGTLRGRLSLRGPVGLRLTPAVAGRIEGVEVLSDPVEGAAAPTGRPTSVAVVTEFVAAPSAGDSAPSAPRFVRFAISGVTAPVLVPPGTDSTAVSSGVTAVSLAGGEYFFELRASGTAEQAAERRALNRRTHFIAREAAAARPHPCPPQPSIQGLRPAEPPTDTTCHIS